MKRFIFTFAVLCFVPNCYGQIPDVNYNDGRELAVWIDDKMSEEDQVKAKSDILYSRRELDKNTNVYGAYSDVDTTMSSSVENKPFRQKRTTAINQGDKVIEEKEVKKPSWWERFTNWICGK